MQITKGNTRGVGDKKRSTVLHKKTRFIQGKFETPQVPLEWPRFHTGNGISRKEQDVAIPSRTKFERVYAGRNEKRPPIFPGKKVGDYNRVGTILDARNLIRGPTRTNGGNTYAL